MRLSITIKSLSRAIAIAGGVAVISPFAVAQKVDSGALFEQYCSKCHNPDDYSGGLDL
jgi:mono/diheme cytochrome c family protein